jgi:hypothetical protein
MNIKKGQIILLKIINHILCTSLTSDPDQINVRRVVTYGLPNPTHSAEGTIPNMSTGAMQYIVN